jgi:hypothetical protein
VISKCQVEGNGGATKGSGGGFLVGRSAATAGAAPSAAARISAPEYFSIPLAPSRAIDRRCPRQARYGSRDMQRAIVPTEPY